jgi:hypothetical protein
MTFCPEQHDGFPLVLLAQIASEAEFGAVWQHRSPMNTYAEQVEWCLYSAIESANLGVVRFLFENGHATISTVRRTSLCHLTLMLSQRPGGKAMLDFLLAKGLDLESPISQEHPVTLLEQAEAEGLQSHCSFLREATGV